MLIDQYRFQSDHIEIVQNATLKDMKVKLDKMHDQVKDNDSLLIYYAGHGYQDNSFGGKGYWMPVDALPAWSEASPRTTWFANSIVHQAIEVSRAKHILLISDSCYAGTLKYRSTQQRQLYAMSESFIFSLAGKKSRRAITSGDLEPVLDSDGEGGNLSLFARHLTETLSNAEGPLNAQRLFDIVRGKVYKRQGQHPQYFTIPQSVTRREILSFCLRAVVSEPA
ncbi:hypothetical protein C2W62_21215 [Candidatus Entotheonella serta]|nr:hypothetical protein C2W62_21215 [Candidatus Entotheonella serta]